jgi:hypothetical protein
VLERVERLEERQRQIERAIIEAAKKREQQFSGSR